MITPGKPASAVVGTSGRAGERRSEVTASGRSLLPRMLPMEEVVVSKLSVTAP